MYNRSSRYMYYKYKPPVLTHVKNRVLVWDTSSLSHALEDYSHSAVSAYRAAKKRKIIINWPTVKNYLLRRHESEYKSRVLLASCDGRERVCFIPLEILRELEETPKLRKSLRALLLGEKEELEAEYGAEAHDFSITFAPSLHIDSAMESTVERVIEEAERLGYKVGDCEECISIADINALSLAYEKGGVLVTGDRRLMRLARALGVEVYYTFKGK